MVSSAINIKLATGRLHACQCMHDNYFVLKNAVSDNTL